MCVFRVIYVFSMNLFSMNFFREKMSLKDHSWCQPADILAMARKGELQRLGFAPLPERKEWVFCQEFPREAFFLRGAAANVVYRWGPKAMELYNNGDCVIEDVIEKLKCDGLMTNNGADFGFPGSRTVSFSFPEDSKDVVFPEHPNLKITSRGSIAKLGEWVTVGHIEWGGGESIAKVIGGSQLWFICNEIEAGVELFKQDRWTKLRDFILDGVTSDAACTSSSKRKAKIRYFYHLAEPEDVIVQPSCAVHAVLTEEKRNRKNELIWSVVSGYEAIGTVFDADRGRHVINRLCIGFQKGLAAKEIRLHGVNYFLRLLLVRDYRKSVRECESGFPKTVTEADITTHIKTFVNYEYDIAKSLEAPNRPLSRKQKRIACLPGRNEVYTTVLQDVSDEELRAWPKEVTRLFDQYARRKIEFS